MQKQFRLFDKHKEILPAGAKQGECQGDNGLDTIPKFVNRIFCFLSDLDVKRVATMSWNEGNRLTVKKCFAQKILKIANNFSVLQRSQQKFFDVLIKCLTSKHRNVAFRRIEIIEPGLVTVNVFGVAQTAQASKCW